MVTSKKQQHYIIDITPFLLQEHTALPSRGQTGKLSLGLQLGGGLGAHQIVSVECEFDVMPVCWRDKGQWIRS